jgi:glycine/D-amino acid oxidase-like deaminating enzyme
MHHELSFWERESFLSGFDIVIIGAGIVGLSTAIYLKIASPHRKVLVLERGVLPYGASTRNAGFACFGSISELIADLSTQPESAVFGLLEKRYRGLLALRNMLGEANMEYEPLGNYEVFSASEKELQKKCLDALPYFNQKVKEIIGIEECYTLAPPHQIAAFGFENISAMIHNRAEGQLHAGKMMANLHALALEKGVKILTGITVQHWEENNNGITLYAENSWKITTPKLVVTTNGFAAQLLPDLEVKPGRNQVWITSPLQNLPVKGAFHLQEGYYYFRNVGNRILIGGGRHLAKEAETTYEFGMSPIIQTAIQHILENIVLPHRSYEVEMKWSGILGLGKEKSPIIRMYSPNIAVGVRMGGMGVAIGNLVGKELAELINATT